MLVPELCFPGVLNYGNVNIFPSHYSHHCIGIIFGNFHLPPVKSEFQLVISDPQKTQKLRIDPDLQILAVFFPLTLPLMLG